MLGQAGSRPVSQEELILMGQALAALMVRCHAFSWPLGSSFFSLCTCLLRPVQSNQHMERASRVTTYLHGSAMHVV